MIPRIDEFIPLGAPGSPVPKLESREALVRATARLATNSPDGLTDAVQRSFRLALLEAIARAPRGEALAPPALTGEPGGEAVVVPAFEPPPTDEAAVIRDTAAHAGVDERFLTALRRAENGGPGREFGVLSVPAPTYEDQARVAAESIRRNVERFERTGGAAIDPVSGQYTDEFIRFFSNRWAPIEADNDPRGLNRYHARNLLRIYAQLAPKNE